MNSSIPLHFIFALLAVAPCAAQSSASVTLNAGSATDITGAGSNAVTIVPSWTRVSLASSMTVGASATKFATEAWSAGASAALNAHASDKAISPVLDITTSAATTSYDFSYGSVDVVPSVEGRLGPVRLFTGARLGGATARSRQSWSTAPLGPIPHPGSDATASTTAATLMGGLSAARSLSGRTALSVGYRAERGRVAGRRQSDHTMGVSLGDSRLSLSATVGERITVDGTTTHGSGALTIGVSPAIAAQFAAGSYPSNPMLGTAAGRFVNAGLTMSLGRRAAAMPSPARVAKPVNGVTRFAIRAKDASRVELGGDFNKWQPVPTTRADDGVWYADIALPPGEYRYAFRIDGKEWRVPEGVAAADDEFGGKTAWMTVRKDAKPVSK